MKLYTDNWKAVASDIRDDKPYGFLFGANEQMSKQAASEKFFLAVAKNSIRRLYHHWRIALIITIIYLNGK